MKINIGQFNIHSIYMTIDNRAENYRQKNFILKKRRKNSCRIFVQTTERYIFPVGKYILIGDRYLIADHHFWEFPDRDIDLIWDQFLTKCCFIWCIWDSSCVGT